MFHKPSVIYFYSKYCSNTYTRNVIKFLPEKGGWAILIVNETTLNPMFVVQQGLHFSSVCLIYL
jgi:hypothetical protein